MPILNTSVIHITCSSLTGLKELNHVSILLVHPAYSGTIYLNVINRIIKYWN